MKGWWVAKPLKRKSTGDAIERIHGALKKLLNFDNLPYLHTKYMSLLGMNVSECYLIMKVPLTSPPIEAILICPPLPLRAKVSLG